MINKNTMKQKIYKRKYNLILTRGKAWKEKFDKNFKITLMQ